MGGSYGQSPGGRRFASGEERIGGSYGQRPGGRRFAPGEELGSGWKR